MITLFVAFSLTCFADDVKTKASPLTLVYEIEKPNQSADQKVNMKRLSLEVKLRLDFADISHAVIKATTDSRLAVELPDGSPKLVDRAKKAISRAGNVEFRVAADKRDNRHSALIQRARAEETKIFGNEVRDAEKKLIGKWATLRPGVTLADSIMRRKGKASGDEFLVVIDPFNVTGQYITTAYSAFGERGAEVRFELDEKGAKLFGELTGSNLPDPASAIGHTLLTIVDDDIQSGATIESRITSNGRITGHFTEAEALNLAYSLKSDPLSAKLKLVSESKQEAP
jgi:preprotein translocase subunit SecD